MALQDTNVIELLSSEYETQRGTDVLSPSTTNLLNGEPYFDYEKVKRKRIAKVLIAVTAAFVLMSCLLLGLTLNMTKDIDEKVRNSNKLLNKHSQQNDFENIMTSHNDTLLIP